MKKNRLEKKRSKTPILCVVGSSNSGKTNLVEELIKELSKKGYQVGSIKHTHHKFEPDRPGKDSWRHRKAGSKISMICSRRAFAIFSDWEQELSVEEIGSRFFHDVDLILVEGYKNSRYPKIVVAGKNRWDPTQWNNVKAMVSNQTQKTEVVVFKPREIKKIVQYFEEEILA